MSANFDCPNCGTAVEATADYIARGLKCPNCGTGFIPVERKTRVRERAQTLWEKIFLGAVLALLVMWIGSWWISGWAVLAIAGLGLLAGILFVLVKRSEI